MFRICFPLFSVFFNRFRNTLASWPWPLARPTTSRLGGGPWWPARPPPRAAIFEFHLLSDSALTSSGFRAKFILKVIQRKFSYQNPIGIIFRGIGLSGTNRESKMAKFTCFYLLRFHLHLRNFPPVERAQCVHRRGHGEEQMAVGPSTHRRLTKTQQKALLKI